MATKEESDMKTEKKPKRKFKKFTKAEREALGLDKVPDTMYDLSRQRYTGPKYPEYEPVKPKALDFKE